MSAPVAVGEVLAGKYEVERILGMGGMGVVVAARHIQLDERVAIKFLLPEAAKRPAIVARFLREGRASSRIRSEHVARVYDVGTLESGPPYIVMEYLEGSDLAAIIKQLGPLSVEEAVEYVLQACEALAEAHTAGIVHRDLKPGNLFLTTRADGSPSVKVIDFGISKVAERQGEELEITGTLEARGSPLFMSPEQMVSTRDVDHRSDIWSLGIALFHLLTAEYPFHGATMPQICGLVLTAEPRRLRSLRPDAPPELEVVLLRCLEKDPQARWQNVAQLALALCDFGPPQARISAERAARVLGGGGARHRASHTSHPSGLSRSSHPSGPSLSAAADARERAAPTPQPAAPEEARVVPLRPASAQAAPSEAGRELEVDERSGERVRAGKAPAQPQRGAEAEAERSGLRAAPSARPRGNETSGVRRVERDADRAARKGPRLEVGAAIDTSTPAATSKDHNNDAPRKRVSAILAAGVASVVMLIAAAAAAFAILRPPQPSAPEAPSAAPSPTGIAAASPPSAAPSPSSAAPLDPPAAPSPVEPPAAAAPTQNPVISSPPTGTSAPAAPPAATQVGKPASTPVAAPTPTRAPTPPRPPATPPTSKPKPPGDDLFSTPK